MGKRLMDFMMIQYSKEMNIKAIRLDVYKNKRAIKLYQKIL
ncbi:hypothetical protein [Lysinibacillus zambalensis]